MHGRERQGLESLPKRDHIVKGMYGYHDEVAAVIESVKVSIIICFVNISFSKLTSLFFDFSTNFYLLLTILPFHLYGPINFIHSSSQYPFE